MTAPLFDVDGALTRTATISDCGTYRYNLVLRWDRPAAYRGDWS